MPEIERLTMPLVNGSRPLQQKIGPAGGDTFSVDGMREAAGKSAAAESAAESVVNEGSLTPAMLLSMLKDPELSTVFIKNISMLYDLVRTMPGETGEVPDGGTGKLFLAPEEIIQELKAQMDESSVFKGEIFDFLREMSENYRTVPETQNALADFLRSVYSSGNQHEVLTSAMRSLESLQNACPQDSEAAIKLGELIKDFGSGGAKDNFPELRQRALAAAGELTEGVSQNKTAETAHALRYNLSRFEASSENLLENALRLWQRLGDKERRQFAELFESAALSPGANKSGGAGSSKVMAALAELISDKTENAKTADEADRLTSVLRNLLMTPCSYAPLLHGIIPLRLWDTGALAELWADPDGGGEGQNGAKNSVHVLMTADVEGAGRFEAEFFLRENTLDFALFCPEGAAADYGPLIRDMPKFLRGTPYSLGRAEVAPLVRQRSLSEVFGTLPKRRIAVDVKV